MEQIMEQIMEQKPKRKPRGPTMHPKIQDARVKAVFRIWLDAINKGEHPNMYQIQRECGYSPASAKAYMAVRTKSWQGLLKEISDEDIMEVYREGLRHEDINVKTRAADRIAKYKGYDRADSGQIIFERKIKMLQKDE